MTYWGAHPSEYDTIYGGGGCLLAALAHLFGLPRFIRILHKYAADEWLGNARTADFKAIIDSNAARDLTGFDPVAFWANWRVD
jgi:aminopeptidase N